MSTKVKLNLLLINSIYWVISSKENSYRPNYTTSFLLCLKWNASQTFESSSCEKLFPKCLCYWYSLLRWMLFVPNDVWYLIFLYTIFSLLKGFFNRHVVRFFERSVLKEIWGDLFCPKIIFLLNLLSLLSSLRYFALLWMNRSCISKSLVVSLLAILILMFFL